MKQYEVKARSFSNQFCDLKEKTLLAFSFLFRITDNPLTFLKCIRTFDIETGRTYNNSNIIRSYSFDQFEIISNIIQLHTGQIDLDPTYSCGNFYKTGQIKQPKHKSDLFPQLVGVKQSNANNLNWVKKNSINTIMFDPPFLAGQSSNCVPSGVITKRFYCYKNMKELWTWYEQCLIEFYRILKKGGHLIFKCQDTISGGKQHWSERYISNTADEIGFYKKDQFLLLAKQRIIDPKHKQQIHARKFHSYFLVFEK